MIIKGISASKGIAIAKVFKIEEIDIKIVEKANKPDEEIKKFNDALKKVSNKILETKKLTKNEEEAAIFDAHYAIANDPFIAEEITKRINENHESAEFATKNILEAQAKIFEAMEDEYMRARAADINDILKKFLYTYHNITDVDLTSISSEVIIVAHDLTPSQTAQLNKKFVKGFATNIGGPTSHTAIMARSLGIASVVGTNKILENVKNGDTIVVDGFKGEIAINPSKTELKKYENELFKYNEYLKTITFFKGKKSLTKDKHQVELAANIGSPNDMDGVLSNDAEAIGLFRSEFLYMDNDHWPTEEEQFKAYKEVVEKMQGKRVIIRTLDIGGDKTLKYFKFPEEMNPFLGYRAIRFCLQNHDIFKTQLRAIIRASEYGKVAIMFPMITNVPEFLEAKSIYEQTYKELVKEKAKVAKIEDIEIGLMIETPAAAILSDRFAKHADFLSIGTNDLIQYSMAADRMNENISYLYQPLNPSILSFIKLVIDGAHKHKKWAGMCGEMAGDLNALPILLGLGLDEFSMSASNILPARELISKISFAEMQKLANKALLCENQNEVKNIFDKLKIQ